MNISKCPKCGKKTDFSQESCPSCGIVFSRYYLSRLKKGTSASGLASRPGKLRLIVDILLGVFGLAMLLTGFVIALASGLSKSPSSMLTGGTSCLVLGVSSFIIGIISLVVSFYGISRSLR